ncbi:hypothetical protein GTY54_48665, partial [Streptomyces sp. SID625]|nr:hypothetical protein [Streptomyces sp. SID625]
MEQPTAHDAPDAVPVRVPRLVGRRAELAQVVGALSRGRARGWPPREACTA